MGKYGKRSRLEERVVNGPRQPLPPAKPAVNPHPGVDTTPSKVTYNGSYIGKNGVARKGQEATVIGPGSRGRTIIQFDDGHRIE
jgi:hypothetical protein